MTAKRLPSGKYPGPVPHSYIEVTRDDGSGERHALPTEAALLKAHEASKCQWNCPHCYHEASASEEPRP